jgi:hypothetical protein
MVSRSNTPINVTLSTQEMMLAAYTGVRRTVLSRAKGSKPAYGLSGLEVWGVDAEGAGGEMAAAKALNLYWDGAVNTYSRGDVGELQIRTSSSHDYKLIVREADSDTDCFVLVTGMMPEYVIHGWILGKAAKQERWKRAPNNRPPAYFVPQSELLSLDTLEIKKSFDRTLAQKSQAG